VLGFCGVVPQPSRDPLLDVFGPVPESELERRAGRLVLVAERIEEVPAEADSQG
jgi:hypothetical protein